MYYNETNEIIHPRPSSIVAALYTLRDLNVEVAILHGPPGCSFKHARLLESENIHVLTSSMTENDFVFGAKEKLKNTINRSISIFNAHLIAIVGTCTSMIIGEDIEEAISEIEQNTLKNRKILCVEIHAGYKNNTDGVLAVLKEAKNKKIIEEIEFQRQKYLLEKATNLEIKYGAASEEYLQPMFGDIKYEVAIKISNSIEKGKKILCVLNAKKETAYVFADEILAIHETAKKLNKSENIHYFCNLDCNLGLHKIKNDAKNILQELKSNGLIVDEIIGGLDEYAITDNKILSLIKEKYYNFDLLFIVGVPHIISYSQVFEIKKTMDYEIISVTNGPRQVIPIKKRGHKYVIVEMDLHPKSIGTKKIIASEFGSTLRKINNIENKKNMVV